MAANRLGWGLKTILRHLAKKRSGSENQRKRATLVFELKTRVDCFRGPDVGMGVAPGCRFQAYESGFPASAGEGVCLGMAEVLEGSENPEPGPLAFSIQALSLSWNGFPILFPAPSRHPLAKISSVVRHLRVSAGWKSPVLWSLKPDSERNTSPQDWQRHDSPVSLEPMERRRVSGVLIGWALPAG